ncbi:MAG: hypothetical protein IKU55_04895 [Clostridia bacterium]|nr:hypothetical protein [Clostridia bacterium]
MIKCIVGLKGFGKTKQLIQMVNETIQNEQGSVLCIEHSPKLTYDINHQCRLIDTVDYSISGFEGFYGFICGLYSQNYDISAIFIDSLYKITGSESAEECAVFFDKLGKFAEKTGIDFTITISIDAADLPESVKAYL